MGPLCPTLSLGNQVQFASGLYLRTVSAWFADLICSSLICGIAFVCSMLGGYWIYGYAALAAVFGLGRSVWVKIQGERVPRIVAPAIHRLVLVFAVVFIWIGVVGQHNRARHESAITHAQQHRNRSKTRNLIASGITTHVRAPMIRFANAWSASRFSPASD